MGFAQSRGMQMLNRLIAVVILAIGLTRAPCSADGNRSAEGGSGARTHRASVYYLFSADESEGRQRAVSLGRRLRVEAVDLELFIIARGTTDPMPADIVSLQADAVEQSLDLPEYIRAHLFGDGDYFAVVDGDGRTRISGGGNRLWDIFTVRTDVEVKTWAKIKDLFN